MKSKFRRLEKNELNEMEDICNVIMSTCVLHNFCINENEYEKAEEADFNIIDIKSDTYVCIGSSRPDSESKRDRIANELV